MATAKTELPALSHNDWPDTVMAPVVDSQVDIAVHPQRWNTQPQTDAELEAHYDAVHWHGRVVDRLLIAGFVTWLCWLGAKALHSFFNS